MPITTRQLEALIRLSQARAKACLRPFVLKEDAEDVIELMKESVNQIHTDEGGIDRGRGGTGGISRRNEKKRLMDVLRKMVGNNNPPAFGVKELKEAAEMTKLSLTFRLQDLIEQLRDDGFILQNKDGIYRLAS